MRSLVPTTQRKIARASALPAALLLCAPTSGWTGGGCYIVLRGQVDTGNAVAELNESNNKDSNHYCPSDSCY